MLVLASASKARSRLLEQAGINHRVMISGINEELYKHTVPKDLVMSLALAKAKVVASKISNYEASEFLCVDVVLGCDSLFEYKGEIFGKPRNSKDAFQRLEKLSGESGFLHTGHALIFGDSSSAEKGDIRFNCLIKDVISTRVNFSKLTFLEISSYVASGEPLNCAGGFSLEGRGAAFIEGIEGCYSNVIGLSLPWLREKLIRIIT